MHRQFASLFILALILGAECGNALADTITVDATSKGTAAKGPCTSDDDLKSAQEHAKEYDGATKFKADYTIVLKADNTVDQTKSSVTFTTVTYTSGGTEVKSNFKTLPIVITSVTLNMDKSVKSFTFKSTDWYPDADSVGIKNNTLSGTINLSTGDSTYTASYIDNSNGAIYTYTVTGKIKAPAPVPGPLPPTFGDPEYLSPLMHATDCDVTTDTTCCATPTPSPSPSPMPSPTPTPTARPGAALLSGWTDVLWRAIR